MKSVFRSAPPSSSGERIKISKREVQRLIEVEVKNAMKKKEQTVDALIASVQQQLDQGMSSEATLQMLQNRMRIIEERAEKALAHLNMSPSSVLPPQTPPIADSTEPQSQLEVKNTKSVGDEGASYKEFMESTNKRFEELHRENAAMRAVIEDLQRESSTPSPTPRRPPGLMEGLAKLMHIKREPTDPPDFMFSTATGSVKRTKEEIMSPQDDPSTKRIKQEPMDPIFPPLPVLPTPRVLSPKAALYKLPPTPIITLAHIKNPSPQISVMWQWNDTDPRCPPMETVRIFFSTKPIISSGPFEEWQELNEANHKSRLAMITEYRAGHKICVAVVFKDNFGRYGPFSKIECAAM